MQSLVPTKEQLEVIRYKNEVGAIQQRDVERLFGLIDYLTTMLDDGDEDDRFGTEGWRHYFGLED